MDSREQLREQNRSIVLRNWNLVLGRCSADIRRLQECVRSGHVQRIITLVSNELLSTFKAARIAITRYESEYKRDLRRQDLAMDQAAREIGVGLSSYIRCCESSGQLMREFNWSFRRRITEAIADGLSIEEVGSKRIDLQRLRIFDSVANLIVSANVVARRRLVNADFLLWVEK